MKKLHLLLVNLKIRSGLSGAVIAERIANALHKKVLVIEKEITLAKIVMIMLMIKQRLE